WHELLTRHHRLLRSILAPDFIPRMKNSYDTISGIRFAVNPSDLSSIEHRYEATCLNDQARLVTGVYDTHGGPEASRFITNHLFTYRIPFLFLRTGVKRFVYVSATFYKDILMERVQAITDTIPTRHEEIELLVRYPYGHVILRPGFVYGNCRVGNPELPLDVIGSPLEEVN
ncbi:hypothetical protein M8C21_025107, partial [Ambrosia artemisiifolia]